MSLSHCVISMGACGCKIYCAIDYTYTMLVIVYAVIRAVLSSEGKSDISGSPVGVGLRGKLNKVVLAYSGGLDTSVIVPWLRYCL